MIRMGERGKRLGPRIVETERHIVVEGVVIFLQRSDIIGSLLGDHLGALLLTPHRITGACGTSAVQHVQQGGNGGHVIGLVIHFALPEHETIAVGPGAHHVDGRLRRRPIKGMPQCFTVNRHDIATGEIAQRRRPRQKALRQFVRGQARQDPPKRLMPGNAMGSVQDLSAPSGLGLAVLLNIFPAIRPTQHGTHGNDQ